MFPNPQLIPRRIIARSVVSARTRTVFPSRSTSAPPIMARNSAASNIFAGFFARWRRSTDLSGLTNSGPNRAGRSISPDSYPYLNTPFARVMPFPRRTGPDFAGA